MKAWQIKKYGKSDVFELNEIPVPQPKEGWILIDVKAFGINRSELYTRQGHSGKAVSIPRVLGIECVGIIADSGGTDLKVGQKAAAAMGGMGREFDGAYAEKALIPRNNVYPVDTRLDWETFGALPESYLTAWGAVVESIDIKPGNSLLIRGGTSSVGMASISLAKDLGCDVIATTRSEKKAAVLKKAGADHVLIDSGNIQDKIKEIAPVGVNGVVELVGIEKTIMDSLASTATKGTVCMVGFLGNIWDYKFFPWMPSTVNLTKYSSENLRTDITTPVLQCIVNKIESGDYKHNIYKAFKFKDLPLAHDMMEKNLACGKLVVKV